MKNLADNLTEKKVTTTKNVTTEKKSNLLDINLDSLNFDKIEKKIEIKTKIEEKKSSSKDLIYKFQLDNNLTDKQKKSFRTKLRNKRINLEKDILKYYSENNNAELKKEISNFIAFYKENYILNDFSLYSLISNNTDTEKMKRTDETINVIKELLQIK